MEKSPPTLTVDLIQRLAVLPVGECLEDGQMSLGEINGFPPERQKERKPRNVAKYWRSRFARMSSRPALLIISLLDKLGWVERLRNPSPSDRRSPQPRLI